MAHTVLGVHPVSREVIPKNVENTLSTIKTVSLFCCLLLSLFISQWVDTTFTMTFRNAAQRVLKRCLNSQNIFADQEKDGFA